MFSNLKIRSRLILLVLMAACTAIIIWCVSMMQISGFMKQSSKNYDYNTKGIMTSYEIGNALSSIRILMRDVSLVQTVSDRQSKYDALQAAYGVLIQNIDKYNNEVLIYSEHVEEKQYLDTIEENITKYMAAVEESKSIGLEKDTIGLAVDTFMLDYTQNAVNAIIAMNALINFSNSMSVDANLIIQNNVHISIIILTVTLILGITIAISLSIITAKSITKPIGILLKNAKKFAQGSLDFNDAPKESTNEIGLLSTSFAQVINVIVLLLDEMDKMSLDHENGEIDSFVDTDKFVGIFKKVASSTNEMVISHINIKKMAIKCIDDIVNGNFKADIPKLPGKKAFINNGIDNVRNKITMVNDEIISLTEFARNGDLSHSIDIKKYPGDWSDLMNGLNQLMQAIVMPIQEASNVLQHVSKGNFDYQLKGDYKGDFLAIKNSINATVTNVASYINEISKVLSTMSEDDDFNQEITREYVGEFSDIKIALNNIIGKFNNVMSDILIASEQVAVGAKQVSENSMTLAQGSSMQASSVEELNATILTFNENILRNADNAQKAEKLASGSKNNAQKGDQDMKNMLKSMDGINNSSNNIARIIKVIDGIAFQTNLLALNAAVEAARAGEHGKGFAVVAEEVRNLAGRSQQSAKETAGLIEASVHQVNEGSRMAETTAEALNSIVNGVTEVSGIINAIVQSSDEQADAIKQITMGVSQITDVVQSNSATSEKAAAASQELSSQADVLKSLVSRFKLRRV